MPVMDFPSSPINGQQTTDGRYYFDSSVGSTGAWRSAPLPVGGLPAGSIMAWGTNTPPANWLLADGSAVSRSVYSSLFAVIGTQYGAGDGTTTFNLPDLRGRVPVGRNGGTFGTLGATGGAENHTLTVDQMPSHNHTIGTEFNVQITTSTSPRLTAGGTGALSGNTGGGQAHNNLQPYQVVNYIIKFSAGWTAGDSELATRVGAIETADATTNRAGLVPVVPSSIIPVSGTATVNSVGQVTYTGCTVVELRNVFTSAYTNYEVVIAGTKTGTSGTHYTWARLATDSTVQTGNYQAGFNAIESGFTATTNVYESTNVPFVYSALTGNPYATNMTVYNPAVAIATTFRHTSMGYAPGNARQHSAGGGVHLVASSYSSLQLGVTGGVLNGTIQVYGYRG